METSKYIFNIRKHNFCQETYELIGSTYLLRESEIDNKDSQYKKRFLDPSTLKFFISLGGTEKIALGGKFGLGCTISTSISPDKTTLKLTYFTKTLTFNTR